jgi:hypothetical protein
MAHIHADLTIDVAACTEPAFHLTVHGHIHATAARLAELFGAPARTFHGDTDLALWVLDTPAGRVHLASSQLRTTITCAALADAATGQPGEPVCWLVLATTDNVLPWVFKAITGSTAGYPSGARPYFTESTLASFTAAYVDFLFLRSEADTEWARDQDRSDPRYQLWRRRPGQLRDMAGEVLNVLHHYQWSQATEDERAAWQSMGRPVRGHHQSELQDWHQVSRWLYAPIRTERFPHGGDPNLAVMLTGLADTKAEHRPMLLEINPNLDFELHAEHEHTLRALATTPIPGLDALSMHQL